MIKKSYILILFLFQLHLLADSVTLSVKNSTAQIFEKSLQRSILSNSDNIYYKNGDRYTSTNSIIVTFHKGTDIEQFAQKNGLKFIRKINKFYFFNFIEQNNYIEKINLINKLSEVIQAKPNWIRGNRQLN